MVHAHSIPVPYQPGQRAIIFEDKLTRGDTLGYHCTIVDVLASTVRRYPGCPHRWVYCVFVPYFDRHTDVVSRDLFVTGEFNPSKLPADRALANFGLNLAWPMTMTRSKELIGCRVVHGDPSRFANAINQLTTICCVYGWIVFKSEREASATMCH